MKKIFSLLLFGLFALNSFSAVTVSVSAVTVFPTNLNGVSDTARCQHAYVKQFSATGGSGVYRFTVSAGALPIGCGLDSITGLLTGVIGYTINTSVNFTIKARSTTGSTSGTRAYTLYIRNTVLTAPQLVNIWVKDNPLRPDVYDTWYTTFTLPSMSSSSGWNLGGNTVGVEKTFGTNDNFDIPFVANSVEVGRFFSNGDGFNVNNSYFLNGQQFAYNPSLNSTNTSVGIIAGTSLMLGSHNTNFGYNSLTSNSTGASNTALGSECLSQNVGGNGNTAVGNVALSSNFASFNTAIGFRSMLANSTGANNVAVGYNSLASNTVGTGNVAVGGQSLSANLIGINNVVVGNFTALNNNGSRNVFIGGNNGNAVFTGTDNTIIGYGNCGAGALNNGVRNTIIGANFNAGADFSDNVVITDGNGFIKFNTTATNEIHIVSDSVIVSPATPSTDKIKIWVNGTAYYFLTTTIP